MANRTHYSKPYLGFVETGKRPASPDIVQAYENVLGIEGLGMDRRNFLAAVALAPLGGQIAGADPDMLDRIARAARAPHRTDEATLDTMAEVLVHTRRWEDTAGVAAVMPSIERQLSLADHLLSGCRVRVRA